MSTGACLAAEEEATEKVEVVGVGVSAEKAACAANMPDFMAVCVPCTT